jgi:hypothetical protein
VSERIFLKRLVRHHDDIVAIDSRASQRIHSSLGGIGIRKKPVNCG